MAFFDGQPCQSDDSIQVNPPEEKKAFTKPSGEYFIPVDYETYAKWMAEKQNQKPQPANNPPIIERVTRMSIKR